MEILHQSINQNAQVLPKRKRSSSAKNRLAYWKERIFLPTYQRNGETITSPNYAIELQFRGERVRWSLGPALNRGIAAQRAQTIYFYLHANGWEATRAKYRPGTIAQSDPSIGQFIEAVTRTSGLAPKTLKTYVNSLRKIAGDIAGVSDDNRKYGGGKGHREWLARIDALRLSVLTPANIQQWKVAFIALAGNDPLAQRSARTSANSFYALCPIVIFQADPGARGA